MTRKECIMACPFCGRIEVGVKERILKIFEKTTLKQCWAYCRYCGAEGRKATIEAVDSEKGRDVEAAALEGWATRSIIVNNNDNEDLHLTVIYEGKKIVSTPLYRVGVQYKDADGVQRAMYDYLTKAAIELMISNLIDKLGGEKENVTN